MEKDIEPMDILRLITPEDEIIADIGRYFKTSYPDDKGVYTVVFYKDTPKDVLNLFVKNTKLFPKLIGYKVSKKYEIEK